MARTGMLTIKRAGFRKLFASADSHVAKRTNALSTNTVKNCFIRITLFMATFLPFFPAASQGLIEPFKFDRDFQEDLMLFQRDNTLFRGFYLTSFERPVQSLPHTGLRSLWLKANGYDGSYIRGTLHYSQIQERETQSATMGNADHPVRLSSLLQGSRGLPLRYGDNTYAQLETEWHHGQWLFVRGSFYGGGGSTHPYTWYFFQDLYSELRINKLVLSVGRKPLAWGQSHIGPILYSQNARSLDMIQLSTLPVQWPWIFRYLGHIKAEIFMSRLDAERDPGHDWLSGWRLGLKPSPWFEINLGMIYQFWGRGVDSSNFKTFMWELLGIRESYSENIHDSSNATNRAFAGDIRLNIQNAPWPFSLYSEQHLEDCCGDLSALIKNGLSYTFGTLVSTGKTADAHRFRMEYSKTGINLYFHRTWPSSQSNAGRIAGHPLGRASQGLYFDWSRDFESFHASAGLFWQQRDRRRQIESFLDGSETLITSYRPDFQRDEKRMGLRSALRFRSWRESFVDLGASGMRVLGKENSQRKTYEWGASVGISRSW